MRCVCGRSVEDGHRYCPACGTLVGHLGADGSPGTGRSSTTLLDPDPETVGGEAASVRVTGSVHVERSGLALRLLGVGLAGVVVMLAWSLFRPSAEEAADPDAASEEVSREVGHEGDDSGDSGDSEVEARAASTRRRTTTTRLEPATTGVVTAPDGSVGPLLGQESGLTLIVGAAGGLTVVDLDTGELQRFDGFRGHPRGMLGTVVVLGDNDGSGGPGLFDLARPEAGPIRLVEGPSWGEVAWIEDDRVWIYLESHTGSGHTLELAAFDRTGTKVEVRDVDEASYGWGPFGSTHAFTLVNDMAGGLYRLEDDRYRRVSTGHALAIGERLALVRECDEVRRCLNHWYDTETFEVLDLPVPEGRSNQSQLQILGGDRWLLDWNWGSNSLRLIEVATGAERQLGVDARASIGPFGPQVALSPDGRWLLEPGTETWYVVDLDRDTTWPIELPSQIWGERTALLVELGD